jgi:uncharacterized protein
MKTIDGQLLKQMIVSGSNNLYNHYPEVDALNVFPVPDGDTGMNMNLTMTSGAKEVQNRNDEDVYAIAKAFSMGLLMGARGNSGVITSQIFRGFADALKGKTSITVSDLSEAFDNGTKVAYKAVIKPVEGTILTVIRETSEKLHRAITKDMSIESAFKVIMAESDASLKRTPNLLPVLKEVGVVDSGGAGLVKIFEGMDSALKGYVIQRNEATAVETKGNAQVAADSKESEFGYCTEFILRLGPANEKKAFNKDRFTSVLGSHGNSLAVVQDDDIVKVHVHTLSPGTIFNYAQQFGEFVKLKCENMTEQHNEILSNEENKNSEIKDGAAVTKKDTNEIEEPKDYALIATSSGKGIDDLFHDVCVNYIVSGGQTMNPSTQDFVKMIKKSNAKVCYIFPNNGNIILAANQAVDIMKDKVEVHVIPTKTIMQGLVCAMNFNADLSVEDNLNVMTEAMGSIKSGAVTFAIKDTEINGVEVKKDYYLAIKESKDIISSKKNKDEAVYDLCRNMVTEDSAIITLIYGSDVKEEDAKVVAARLEKDYPDCDVDLRSGLQPVYSYLIGIE